MRKIFDTSTTDEELVEILRNGGEDANDAFTEIVERYEQKITRYANKFLYSYEDRQDAVQDVFLKAYQNIHSFRSNKPFSPWLYRIAHNTFINVIKKQKRERSISFDTDQIFAWNIPDEENTSEAEKAEDREELERCLGKLDVKYREPLVLYYFEEKSYKEIAEILQVPIATVGVRLKRGRDVMKKFININ